MEQVPQEHLIGSLRGQLGDHTFVKFAHIVRGEVAQPLPFQPTPKWFHRVEHGGPWRQPFQDQPISELGLQRADRLPLVHRAAVPDHYESTGQIPQHRLDEGGHVPAIEGAVGQRVEVEPKLIPPRRQLHRGRNRDLLAVAATPGDRRGLARGGPRAAEERSHQQAALVDQGDMRLLSPGLFFSTTRQRARNNRESLHAVSGFLGPTCEVA